MRLVLPERLDITNEDVVRELCEVLDNDVEIDAGSIVKVDAAGVQLMCAFAAAVRARGARLTWHAVSQVFRDASHILGVDAALALPE